MEMVGDNLTEPTYHDHKKHSPETLRLAIMTVSNSKFDQAARNRHPDDPSGDILQQKLEETDCKVVYRTLLPDQSDVIVGMVKWFVDRVHAIVIVGGTGITPTDTTIEALKRIADKQVPGFGELFRRRSEKEIGVHAALTRATMYIVDKTPVACLPGSPHAAELGAEILVELLPHAVVHSRGDA